ncbi:MAG: epoxyqueuosine reductase QueH [Clostridiales bacterium]|nr:epoxyqueuosine reductase QueH [Clostridiales bacterium]
MKTLLHICCAPCSIGCIRMLRDEGIEPVGFWYNPNIHPYTEYRSRRDALVQYAKDVGLSLVQKDEYGLRSFVSGVFPDFDNRCEFCYKLRLEEVARHAAENGFDNFTTTLLISPYQNHELICQRTERAAAKYGINFLYRDFRPAFREGQETARSENIYMQKYCGCIFSEEDRYLKKKRKKPPHHKPVSPKENPCGSQS